ncbi:MAG: HAD family phosphatase [Exiguobacterium profundum]|nr:MAG: HAD family phosphatase [Exiguobacterium profundum]
MMVRPLAVIFDIGNVLVRWQPEGLYDRDLGEDRRRQLFAEVDLLAMNQSLDEGAPFRQTVEAWAARHPRWSREILWWHDRWSELAAPRIEGAIALQRALRAKGVPVFTLTNSGASVFEAARATQDFLSDFDRFYVSGVLGVARPDPRIYEIVEQDSGIPPDRLIFADDRADNITAAARRGWRTHQFESWRGWARRLVAEDLLTKEEAGL